MSEPLCDTAGLTSRSPSVRQYCASASLLVSLLLGARCRIDGAAMTGVTTAVVCYPVCGMVHVKDILLLIEKSSLCSGGSGFPLSLTEWSITICPTPYTRK